MSLIEFNLLMDILKINVILYNATSFVVYKYNTIHEPCLLMRYENSSDISYIDVFSNVSEISPYLVDCF